MSKLTTTDPKELRPLLHERIEHATDEDLLAVRNLLLEIEIRRVREQLGREVDGLRAAGFFFATRNSKLAPALMAPAWPNARKK